MSSPSFESHKPAWDSFSNPEVLVVIECLLFFLSFFLNPQICIPRFTALKIGHNCVKWLNFEAKCHYCFPTRIWKPNGISDVLYTKDNLRCAVASCDVWSQVAMCMRIYFGWNLRCACVRYIFRLAKCDCNFARFLTIVQEMMIEIISLLV